MKLMTGVGGLVIFGAGVLVLLYVSARLGLLVCGLGVAAMGYWALANENKDYNF
jgi:hypothetical protein